MTNVIKVVATIPSLDTTLDGQSNHFVFETSDTPPYGSITLAFDAVKAFYNTAGGSMGAPMSAYMNPTLDHGSNHSTLTAYDITAHLNGSPAGAPVAAETWTFGAVTPPSTSTFLPAQCAACLSFRSDYGSDVEFGSHTRPRARDRNRIYLAINSSTLQRDATTNRAELSAGFISDALEAMFLLSETHGSGGTTYDWRVWTRVGAAVKLPVEAWLDNQVDTQRRRVDPAPATRTYAALASV